jgi:hypothetical protein
MIPKVLNKLPAITTGSDQLYISMVPPLAHVGYIRGAINDCVLVYNLSCRSTSASWTHLVHIELSLCVDRGLSTTLTT